MRCHPSKRAFLRRYPKPAPPPEGMMFAGLDGQLVSIEAVQREAAARMADHDAKSEDRRRKAQGVFVGNR